MELLLTLSVAECIVSLSSRTFSRLAPALRTASPGESRSPSLKTPTVLPLLIDPQDGSRHYRGAPPPDFQRRFRFDGMRDSLYVDPS